MKTVKLDHEEAELENEIERGEWMEVPESDDEIRKLSAAAGNARGKNRKINIRLTDWDYRKLKARAAEEGLPYQTLVSSIIHKYLTKQLT